LRRPAAIVVMGVAGAGKTVVGRALAAVLGCGFVDADDLHPPENVAKMAAGTPLEDSDRWPWLARVAEVLTNPPVVVACSALRRSYRDHIRQTTGQPVCFVHLAGTDALLAKRLEARAGHFMPPALLASQLATLEPPGPDECAITVRIDPPPEAVLAAVVAGLDGVSGS
jgi:gluconokinase